jgi:ABC-type multidrug transport system permease subunit
MTSVVSTYSRQVWSDVIKGFLILALLAMVFFNFLVWVMRKTRRRWEAKQLQLEMNNDLELL